MEDLLFERGIDICHETVRLWWNRFGPMFAAEIRRKRASYMRQFTHSFAAAAHGGSISLVGLLADPLAVVSPLPVMCKMLTLRGVSVGSRADLEALIAEAAAGPRPPGDRQPLRFPRTPPPRCTECNPVSTAARS